jgi:hypothetical protein
MTKGKSSKRQSSRSIGRALTLSPTDSPRLHLTDFRHDQQPNNDGTLLVAVKLAGLDEPLSATLYALERYPQALSRIRCPYTGLLAAELMHLQRWRLLVGVELA